MQSTTEHSHDLIAGAKPAEVVVVDAPDKELPALLALPGAEDAVGVCDLDGSCR